MKTKNSLGRLSLNRETLARLTARQLEAVNGGRGSILIRCGLTDSCPGCCVSKTDPECEIIVK